ncbi:MAG: histidine kinase dimerization/phospho-acceptor domain-containing protein [Candidatus Marinimicrobia bacterium]|nr:histidine kinase dimerization/phospho-acceptor domain-containing protein [Candidatus Neomarinimicrobiota bacterium]
MVATDFLHEIVTLLQKGLGAGETFEAVFHLVEKSVSFESATLFLYQEEEDKLEIMHQEGSEVVDLIREIPFSRGMGMASWVSQQEKPIILESLSKSRPGKERRFTSFVSLPLRAAGKLIGVLNLGHSTPNMYLQSEIKSFTVMAEELSIIVETFILREKLETKNQRLTIALEDLHAAQGLIVEKERMAAMGELVVTVNHEINNPLTSVIGLAEILELSFATLSPEKAQNAIKAILKEARRIQEITNRLTRITSSENIGYVGDTLMTKLPE